MEKNELTRLEEKAKEIRRLTLKCIASRGVGHLGGSLSIIETLVALYYREMNIDPNNPLMEGRDRLVLSKGHAGPALYSVLADCGFFSKDALLTLNRGETILPSHCDMRRTPGIDMSTGSLGQGLSCAVGMAYGSKLLNDGSYIYAIIGDGESQEGQIWEAAMFAGAKQLDNLIAFTDYNKVQLDNAVENIVGIAPLSKKWEAFRWNVINVVNGNNIEEVTEAIERAKTKKGCPTMIILNTIKGCGVQFVIDAGYKNHSMDISEQQLQIALKELE